MEDPGLEPSLLILNLVSFLLSISRLRLVTQGLERRRGSLGTTDMIKVVT